VRHPNANGRLTAFVFVDFDKLGDALHVRRCKSCCQNLLDALVVFHVAFKDGVQHFVRWQAVLVGLVGTQLRTRGSGDDALRNWFCARAKRIVFVTPIGQLKNRRFGHIFNHRKTTRHIAVERAITRRHLALVTRGQHDRTKLVGQRHQHRATNPCLDVFFGRILGKAFEIHDLARL
jgi:hypothetical protein